MIRISTLVNVTESSGVAEARRTATQYAESRKLGETTVGRAGLVAMELSTNLIKHGGGGSLLIGFDDEMPHSLAVIALDKGRGMASLDTAMRDGYSTAGSPGTGLGAVARAARKFDVYSVPDHGTVVICHVEDDDPARNYLRAASIATRGPGLQIAGISLPKSGETECGDGWLGTRDVESTTIAVIDGLGHGPQAAVASAAASRAFANSNASKLEGVIQDMHDAMRATRGAAVGLARMHSGKSVLEFAGVGNIGATIVGEDAVRRVVSLPGIVGHEMRKVQTFSYPWMEDSMLIMYSDGMGSSWRLEAYPGLSARDPLMAAAVLFRDFCRGSDDVTVVVAKG